MSLLKASIKFQPTNLSKNEIMKSRFVPQLLRRYKMLHGFNFKTNILLRVEMFPFLKSKLVEHIV